jgi:large subunit ribosomal protein L21
MSKYAVIRIQGKQYRVAEGEEILVDKVSGKPEAETLLLVDEGKIKIGQPVLKEVKVTFKIVKEMEKGEKIDVVKYKAKSRYRRYLGFRPQFTRLLVQKIA